jgi:hypothetical protein
MSDHVDGPRSIGDPMADVTDLFAFTSPENPARINRLDTTTTTERETLRRNAGNLSRSCQPGSLWGAANTTKKQT